MPQSPATLRPRGAARAADDDYEARRRRTSAWRAWYKTARWLAIRAAQLNAEPLCRLCLKADRLTPATLCDHVEPHRGDATRFFAGPFQSLCERCHSRDKQRLERRVPAV